ncbi:MAG: DUF1573 domain-containing protein [Cyclobacteriaceae bacterium]
MFRYQILVVLVGVLVLNSFGQGQSGKDESMLQEVDVTKSLPVKMGAISVYSQYLYFGHIEAEKPVMQSFQLYNSSEEPVRIFKDSILSHSFVALSFDTLVILPKSIAEMEVTFDPVAAGSLGFNEYQFDVITDEKGEERVKSFFITATIMEFFPDSLRQQAPKIELNISKYDFKSVLAGESVSASFQIINTGLSILNIREIKSNCTCLTWTLENKSIDPGKDSELKVYFDSTGKQGNQYKSITIFSNDPKNSAQILKVKANVAKN